MSEIWQRYNETNDMEFLAKACEEAPFWTKEMAFEIARILRSVKTNWLTHLNNFDIL